MKKYLLLFLFLLSSTFAPAEGDSTMNSIAQQYVKLVLALGQHDADYVDSYYGPKEWQDEALAHKISLQEIIAQTEQTMSVLANISVPANDELASLRKTYLLKQLSALKAKAEMLNGKKFTFDEESQALFDSQAPVFTEKHFASLLDELTSALPKGKGSLQERFEEFHKHFFIPKEKLDTVFTAAITECRNRTLKHIDLPKNENFVVEYVTDKAWSGYNWYKGNSYSVIQVNTDFPIYIERAVDLAAHEGYPGHHVYNALLESELMRKRGWIEFSVYPLFSPQSLVAEGSANYGIEVVFTHKERIQFEKKVLFPLAGLDPSKAEHYYRVMDIIGKLSYAGNEAARGYLNGTMTKDEAVAWLVKYALMEKSRAEQRIKFIEKYRSYVINYNYGEDLVKRYVERHGGTSNNPEQRWKVFEELLSSPRLPSELR
jgi:hypothetical protein